MAAGVGGISLPATLSIIRTHVRRRQHPDRVDVRFCHGRIFDRKLLGILSIHEIYSLGVLP